VGKYKKPYWLFSCIVFLFPSLLKAAERICIDVKKELASVQSNTSLL
jgi:hypothetical protein